MTAFKIFTTVGNFEIKAASPKDAVTKLMAENPTAYVTKIKRVKEFGK
jgi:hypothetical protein